LKPLSASFNLSLTGGNIVRRITDLESDREDLALLEEMEDFRTRGYGQDVAVFRHQPSDADRVKELGFDQWDSEEKGDSEEG
jgi:hypothetical protein